VSDTLDLISIAGRAVGLWQRVADALNLGIIIYNGDDLLIEAFNVAACDITNIDLSSEIGEPIDKVFPSMNIKHKILESLNHNQPIDLGTAKYHDARLSGTFFARTLPLDSESIAIIFERVSDAS
jgi:PAS domain-containing protein